MVWQRPLIYGLAGLLLLAVLLVQLDDYGVTWDEIQFEFPGAWRQAEWFSSLGPASFGREALREGFASDSQHPSLHRSVMALAWLVLHRGLGVPEVVALRVPQAVYFTVIVLAAAWMMERRCGPAAALVGGLSFVALPRVWGLAHIACLDTVIAVAWLAVVLVFAWAAERPGWRPAVLFGVVYGLAVCTKLHALFIPLPLVVWSVVHRPRAPGKLAVCALVLAPLLYYVLQPGLWYNPISEIGLQLRRYADKETYAPIAVYYLGRTYLHRPPWHYVPVMAAITVPVFTLAAILVGLGRGIRQGREDAFPLLLALNLLAALAIFLLPKAGVYDGVRLFLPAFYFGACLAGYGVAWGVERIRAAPLADVTKTALATLLAGLVLVPGVAASVAFHPAQLAYYNALVGGPAGAARLGMQTIYWGELITPEVLTTVNAHVPPGATLKPLALPEDALVYYQRTGALRADIVLAIGDKYPPPYDFHLLQARQSFFNSAAWYFYRHAEPRAAWYQSGVLLVGLYGPR